ncbi:hypothetical protein DPMN_106815 [Dreissena polymorpha]|uniref:Reverse transcriptase domain-containing protein n=1 Tax=Dreissena polymorpha TaxID=45954 RepID=A0A9D4QJE6_DREPO|nr:hypothetical protein DPMN_106815 [Dreissena polymorpha]
MKTSTEHGIQSTLWKPFEDLDFADDLALIYHTQQHMQDNKTNMEADNTARLGLAINRGKSNVFRTKASNNTSITVQGCWSR